MEDSIYATLDKTTKQKKVKLDREISPIGCKKKKDMPLTNMKNQNIFDVLVGAIQEAANR